jgi:hypothetical protein
MSNLEKDPKVKVEEQAGVGGSAPAEDDEECDA